MSRAVRIRIQSVRVAPLHRNRCGDALDRLDARHFINRHRVRVSLKIQIRSLLVSLTNELHLLIKHLLAFLFRVEPILAAVRLKVRFLQIAADLTDRYRRHDSSLDDFVGQLTMRPAVRSVAPSFRRGSQATAKICVTCSPVNVPGAPLRGASLSTC